MATGEAAVVAAAPVPSPEIRERAIDPDVFVEALAAGLHPVAARVLAGRTDGHLAQLTPSLSDLDHYQGLPGIERAAERIATAILEEECIGIETDHDVDGVTGHAIIRSALIDYFAHPAELVTGFIGHRLQDGYGLSDPVADRILAADPRPTLVITADNGSSDEPRIARLAEAGIDVIVTDHHELPAEGPPGSAYACVTPRHPDSRYPDPAIAGCTVAWLLLCAVRRALIAAGRLPQDAPSLAGLLDFVALGTVADCVSLGPERPNNRALVLAGLARIEAGSRPCWRALRSRLRSNTLTAADLAFGIGPRLNARGRLAEAMPGVEFLLSETDAEAAGLAELLDAENTARRQIERAMRDRAMAIAAEQVERDATALVVWMPDGHPGVHGIVASRLVEAFGRPAVCLSPREGQPGVATGSARGIPGLHVRDAMQSCADAHPGLLRSFGGHAGAGGLSLEIADIDRFAQAFDAAARERLAARPLGPVIWTDGELAGEDIGLDTIAALAGLEPFGRGFEAPVFSGAFEVAAVSRMGDGSHLRLALETPGGGAVQAVWFGAVAPGPAGESEMPVRVGQRIRAAYEIALNEWQGRRSVQLRVRALGGGFSPTRLGGLC
jgi:single-stranded-DNA-specific exonuclease